MPDWSQLLDWNEYVKLLFGLFAISTPLAAVPVYLSLTAHLGEGDRRRVAVVVTLTYLVTLCLFATLGEQILAFFGITIAAFKVAGGILLLVGALNMLRSAAAEPASAAASSATVMSIAVVPLTIPILAGPGAITLVMISAHDHPSLAHQLLIAAVVATIALSIYLAFRAALAMGPLLGPAALQVVNQAMALIIAAIAVELVLEGVMQFFAL